MNFRSRATARAGLAALVLGAGLAAAAPAAHADAPYTNTNSLGGVLLYDPSNNVISKGSTTKPFSQEFSKAIATGLGETKAQAAPVSGGGWAGDSPNGATVYTADLEFWQPIDNQTSDNWQHGYPIATSSATSNVQTAPKTANPRVTQSFTNLSIDDMIAQVGASTGADANHYEIRLRSFNDADGPSDFYYAVEIRVNPTAHTWQAVQAAGTYTAFKTITPASGTATGTTNVTFVVHVQQVGNNGKIKVYDGTPQIGTTGGYALDASGNVTITLPLATGTHKLKFVYLAFDKTYRSSNVTTTYVVK